MDMRLNGYHRGCHWNFYLATLMFDVYSTYRPNKKAGQEKQIKGKRVVQKRDRQKKPFNGFNFQFKIANSIAFYQELH